eukprot:g30149.t1
MVLFPAPKTTDLEPHAGPVTVAAFSPFHRKLMLTGSADGSVKLFDVLQQRAVQTFFPPSKHLSTCAVSAAAWSSARPCVFAVAMEMGGVYLYDLLQILGTKPCVQQDYALTFLQSGADYEVQVDWRWQRLGDSFLMPAYPAKRFHMPSAPQQPPLLRPLRILPEVLDGHEQLQSLCNLCQQEGQRLGRGFGLFEWPFEQPPALAQMLALAPTGSQLTEEWRRDPGLYGTFTVQCRRQSWVLCQVALLEISGKAACFVFAPPEQPLEDQRTADATDEPKPTPLPEMPQLEDGDMEFRVLRTNDCEVSEVLTYPALPLEPPVDVQCRLKMTGPQSAFGLDSAELETSPWELIGQVMADIDDASGKGCYQLQSRRKGHTKEELLQSFHAKDGRPRDEQLDGLFGRRSETVELSPCEWSAPLLSAWHRTPEAVPPPPAPREAVVPDPPHLELLEEGSVLLIFDELPIREPKR